MASPASMTAAVWLAPMIPRLPLPLAQRVERLLEAKPGRETEEHALCLCEAIVAYAACMRASVAAAVLPADQRSSLNKGVAELRRAVQQGRASIANFRDLLSATADAIEQLEPGHPLGRAELTRPRTAWIARTQLVDALGDSVAVSESVRTRALEGGIAGIVDLWVQLVEARREVEIDPDGDPWLSRLGDLIVDMLGSSLLGDASLVHADPTGDGELRRLHGIESEVADKPDAHEPGVGWSFDERGVSACGLLSYWLDEHEFEHVGVIAKQGASVEYLDYGSGVCSARADARVAWDRLQVAEVVVAPERNATPVFAIVAGVVAALLVIVGIGWALWPANEQADSDDQLQQAAAEPTKLANASADNSEQPEPEPVAELVIEGEQPDPDLVGRTRPASDEGETGLAAEEALVETEAPTTSLWFESERNLGTCQVSYGGRTRTANLHLKTRQVEGPLEFSYRCGEHRGRGSIDVKLNRVNGVLFCKKNGSVKVKTVRSNEGRCDR